MKSASWARSAGVIAAAGLMTTGAAAQTAQPPTIGEDALQSDRTAQNVRDFDFVVERIRLNYAGWDTKVTDRTRPQLDALTERLRESASRADDQYLLAILREWIAFFEDKHLQVSALGAVPTTSPGPQSSSRRPWTEASVRARIAALGARRDPLEGIWRIGGGRYRVGIMRTDSTLASFAAVVLTTNADTWKTGDVKADISRRPDGTIAMQYRRGDHGVESVSAAVVADGRAIRLDDWGLWTRELPALADPDSVAREYPSDELFLKRLSPTTLWLRIPDFHDDRAAPLKALLETHRAELDSTPHLIIDIRDNGGGSDYVYAPLQPLMYTQPVVTIGAEMRSSADNIAGRQKTADSIRKSEPAVAAELDRIVAMMAANPGKYVKPEPRGFSIDRRDVVLPFPKRIALLIDGAGSTAEQFILEARQSRKVTLFGQKNSAGVLDYANVESLSAPSGRFAISWATSRSLRLPDDPVDPNGIAPDIGIGRDVQDPVAFADKWLDRSGY